MAKKPTKPAKPAGSSSAAKPPEPARPATGRKARPSALLDTRVIYCGDNLEQLAKLPDKCVDLIYIDPPFNSNRNYEVFWGESKEKRSFDDRHESTQAYIDYMRPRCQQLARVLKPTGSFYYHCDWHASHYVKVMLDQLFGENNFQNEIIWQRTSAHNDPRQYGRVHDTIFYYNGGDEKGRTWNQQYDAIDEDFFDAHDFELDEHGKKYRKRDLTAPDHGSGNGQYVWKGKTPPPGRMWSYTEENMRKLEAEGRVVYTKTGMPRMKIYVEDHKGIPLQSVWSRPELWLNSASKERLGYPTQKPLALLERIINTSSNPNDIVLDAFCGCGTALVAAQNLGRQWIGIDISPTACRVMAKRLKDVCKMRESEPGHRAHDPGSFIVRDLPWTIEKLRAIPPFEFENWAVIALGGIPNKVQVGDMGIDGRIFPVGTKPSDANSMFAGDWFPIQVKQMDKVGRPDIDQMEAVMTREDRQRGFFVAFGFTADAESECASFHKKSGRLIKLITVQEILDEQHVQKM